MKKNGLMILALLITSCAFFYKTVLSGWMPFPGDLLVNTNPYRTESFLGYSPNAYPNKAQGKDILTQIYPWKYFSIQQLKKGEIPFWNPHNFSGNIQMQNLQTAVFYPLNVIFLVFSFNTAWSFFILSQPLLAIIFMYLFLQEIGLSKWASSIGGLAFAFSSYMTVWMEYGNIDATLLWLPLLLLLILRFLRTEKIRYWLGFITAGFIMILAGYIQGAFYSLTLSFFFMLVALLQDKKKFRKDNVFFLLSMFLAPVFLASFQIIPTLEIFKQSTRGAYSLSQIQSLLQPPFYWVTLFVPDFFGNPATRNFILPLTYIERVSYIGVPLLLFILFSIFRAKHSHKNFFLIVSIICFFLTTNLPGVAYFYRLPIPVLSTTVPTRVLSLFIFSLIVLGAMGIHEWLKEGKIQKRFGLVFLSIYGIIWSVVLLGGRIYPSLTANLIIAKHNLYIPTVLALATVYIVFLMQKRFSNLKACLIFLLLSVDLFYFFAKITPFSPQKFTYPQTPVMTFIQQHSGIQRFWGYGSAYIESNFQSVDNTYSPEGNDPLHIHGYGQVLASSGNGEVPDVLPRQDANVTPGFGKDDLKNNVYRQKMLNLLGVKYVLNMVESDAVSHPDEAFSPEIYSLIWYKKPWQIYENKEALPRYFLASDYVAAKDTKDAITKIYSVDLSKTLVIEGDLHTHFGKNAKGTVSLDSYTPNKVVLTTNTNQAMLLFLSDTYYPSWIASVDNQLTTIFQADGAFRAVVVPKGQHMVTFRYNSSSFQTGLEIATITLLIIAVVFVVSKKYEKVF